jgi:thiol:disulfide interchange protein DsbC
MKKAIEKRPDIAFYIKFFPIKKETRDAIKSITCTRSLALLDKAYKGKEVPIHPCAQNINIERMVEFARSLGINVVPTLIMPDGRVHSGYVTAESLIKIIDGGNNEK